MSVIKDHEPWHNGDGKAGKAQKDTGISGLAVSRSPTMNGAAAMAVSNG
jgi:hypothetical protein